MSDAKQAVLEAAIARAKALADSDAEGLRSLLHPDFGWVSHKGEMFDRDRYVAANTGGTLVWSDQGLADPRVTVIGSTAILRCMVTDTIETPTGPNMFRMPMTQVWIHQHGQWLCAGGHAGPRMG